ncbi:DUF1349 domain-containing protein [Flammeovirga pectinis]|uniref:DUF1349 domain-containing protein n=1 Tax=Flammeovirga pectinis TaxID=2494373 RepID=A0A3Q9FQB6_9BACT|nr:DUF1349 domain-containing protein [Flammeovirga pectinis]AZQ62314.1 DUF1349 domain-containing protein [Flammeovirga pectinis]
MNKKITLAIVLLIGSITFCNAQKYLKAIDQSTNLLNVEKHQDIKSYKWLNKPQNHTFSDKKLIIEAGENTDYFNNPETNKISSNAPFLYNEVEGDFVATVLIKPDLSSVWNACGVMVYFDSLNWIKFEFENSDATGNSIVSVVTKELSDDSNGAVLNKIDHVWLRVTRKEDVYSMFYSNDGVDYKMARLVSMKGHEKVYFGLEAQCPASAAKEHSFLYYSLEKRTIGNIRTGV